MLRGGPSSEYDFSLRTGTAVAKALPEEKYDVRDIYIDKQGYWHQRGVAVDPHRALNQIDVVINALHGGIGEDGTVQRILERAAVPYVGSPPMASALSLNKIRAREVYRTAGIMIPRAVSFGLGTQLTTGEMAGVVFEHFGAPYVVKPVNEGASQGIRIAHTILELPDALGDVLDEYGAALVEEFIQGAEAQVGIIEGFRDTEVYALPPARIVRPEGAWLLGRHHVAEGLHHMVPSDFEHDMKEKLATAARAAHLALGLGHLSMAGFIVTVRGPYLLEVDALPHLHESALFPTMLESVGSSVGEMLEHLINLARR